jgi:hypothetical protein
VPQNNPGCRNEFLPVPWEILGHPNGRFMERACDTPLRDMLDEVALDLKNNYISEVGTKQSFNYDVSAISNITI